MQLLKEHYTSERNIGFYADKLCLSPKYLSQMVLAASGRHVKDWVQDYVIGSKSPAEKPAVHGAASKRYVEFSQPIVLRGLFQESRRLFAIDVSKYGVADYCFLTNGI